MKKRRPVIREIGNKHLRVQHYPAIIPRPWVEVLLESLGWFSMIGLLGSYFAVSFNLMSVFDYNVVSTATGFAGAAYLLPKKAWPTFWLNFIWGVISLVGVWRSWP